MTRTMFCAALFVGVGAATLAPGIAGANTLMPSNPVAGCAEAYVVTGPGKMAISDPNLDAPGTVNGTFYQLAPPFTGPVQVTSAPGVIFIDTGTAPGIGMLSGSYTRTGQAPCDLVPTIFFQP